MPGRPQHIKKQDRNMPGEPEHIQDLVDYRSKKPRSFSNHSAHMSEYSREMILEKSQDISRSAPGMADMPLPEIPSVSQLTSANCSTGAGHVTCDNLSLSSISHMRPASAKWQHVKFTNGEAYFYSAFWETRFVLKQVRLIGMFPKQFSEKLWCHLWYEGQCYAETIRATKRARSCSRCPT